MDISVIAQLLTGLATLIIGAVLVFQLRKQNQQIEIQNRQLELQHQDSDRELAFSARARGEELTLARLTNDSLLDAYMKVGRGEDTASDKEIHQFISYMRTSYLQMINAWNLGANDRSVDWYKGNLGNLMGSVGERKYYLTNGRIIIGTVFGLNDLLELGDTVYEELEGSPVPA
ncbi:MAG TPA: hypothetical protein DCS57_04510 [Dehalococcoidia bacterium]|nr:hypothetical protein [Dehalococcoidia bacterium]|tara:strand:+ start:1043 stop:1564 length:522 start_codon:yes stop_codon:yes gene_type:complete